MEMKKVIIRKGPDRVLYGSDAPWRVPAQSWQRFLNLNLPGPDFEKIAGQNLQDLLKI
jgi:predicted TIM-barrel fold metal-dependent hydrolase